jgi:hypothetical protein
MTEALARRIVTGTLKSNRSTRLCSTFSFLHDRRSDGTPRSRLVYSDLDSVMDTSSQLLRFNLDRGPA